MNTRVFAVLATLLVPGLSLQQVSGIQVQTVQTVSDFVDQHPGVRFYGTPFHRHQSVNDESNTFAAIYGASLATGDSPADSAWNHVAEIAPLLGDDWGQLVPEVSADGETLHPVMRGAGAGQPGFFTFRFYQQFQGLPVFRSGIGFLVRNDASFPLVVSGFDIKHLAGFDTGGFDASRPVATRAMLGNVQRLMNVGSEPGLKSVLRRPARMDIAVSDAQYVIYAGSNGSTAPPQVALQFTAERGSIQTLPDYHKYLIVASVATGDILVAETSIHEVDITGKVSGRATSGLASLECDPEIAVGMPWAEANVVGGNSVFADANGNFVIPHAGSSAATVRSRLCGRWFEVFDQAAGNSIPELTQTVTPPGPANFLHNPAANQEFQTANVNAYLESNVVRDYVLAYQPSYPVIGTQTAFDVNTNIASTCNAFYNGSSINFYQAGGGCNNTSFSDVIYHEYGHHLINVTGNGQGQLGEGTGDVMGVLIQDDPLLGNGFQGNCSAGIRTADNTLQYPCSGAIHFCGQLISGAVWDTRLQLAITEPSNFRDINATLYLGMLMVRGQMIPGDTTIDPFITVLYLELDDDDSNIGNGTPHYNEIATGFGLHNLDAPPLSLLDFSYPDGRPEMIAHNGGVEFMVEVSGLLESPRPNSAVLHVDRGNGFESFPMNEVSPHLYQAIFPAAECAQIVAYYVSAETASNNTQQDPPGAPAEFFTAIVATDITTTFSDNCESNLGWSVSGNASTGQWERGVPAGGGDRGDPAVDGDGSGQCYLTENVDGDSDVDGGSTILTSPILDASTSGNQVAVLSYRRWYSNNFGADPENDVFVVEISNNGGAAWVNLETVGPGGPEVRGGWIEKSFVIADVIAPTSQMRIRFNASDLASGSVVEAGVDAISIKLVTCEHTTVFEGAKLFDGNLTAGPMTNINVSDDVPAQFAPSPTSNPVKQIVDLYLQSTSAELSPSSLRFRVEASAAGGPPADVIQSVRMYNLQTETFEVVDTRSATSMDSIVDIALTGDLSRFVNQANGEITAEVRWESPSFGGPPFNWTIDLDEAVWIIE
jgi:hypothetical protein